jgi:hypothetical protein
MANIKGHSDIFELLLLHSAEKRTVTKTMSMDTEPNKSKGLESVDSHVGEQYVHELDAQHDSFFLMKTWRTSWKRPTKAQQHGLIRFLEAAQPHEHREMKPKHA